MLQSLLNRGAVFTSPALQLQPWLAYTGPWKPGAGGPHSDPLLQGLIHRLARLWPPEGGEKEKRGGEAVY